MEDILEVYSRPYDEKHPVVCMDEKPVQLLAEARNSITSQSTGIRYQDNEYVRNGTCSIFLFTEPLAGWRYTEAKEQRTRIDWAESIKWLLDEQYPDAEQVILVCDNLNTHKIASLYEAFPPDEALRLAKRLEIHHTPKHGSWLDIAEIELSALGNQCLSKRRISNVKELNEELSAWNTERNAAQRGVNWQFTTADARIKLKHLYPSELIRERTMERLASARARGRMGGRPGKDKKTIDQALTLYDSKAYSVDEISKTTGISRATLYKYVKLRKENQNDSLKHD